MQAKDFTGSVRNDANIRVGSPRHGGPLNWFSLCWHRGESTARQLCAGCQQCLGDTERRSVTECLLRSRLLEQKVTMKVTMSTDAPGVRCMRVAGEAPLDRAAEVRVRCWAYWVQTRSVLPLKFAGRL